MEYLVAYLPKGLVKRYHFGLATELSNKFGIPCVLDKSPAHVTLKTPFEADETTGLERGIEEFCSRNKPPELTFSGFGNFNGDVFYIDIQPSMAMHQTFKGLLQVVKGSGKLEFGRFDGESRKLHLTVAVCDGQKKRELAKYIEGLRSPYYQDLFNNVAILRKKDSEWELYREFNFSKT